MNKRELHIAEPCHVSWDSMRGDDRKRFCSSCSKHVHNLSALPRTEAAALLRTPEAQSGSMCVQYKHDDKGRVRFADTPTARRGVVATAAFAASLFAACGWPVDEAQFTDMTGASTDPEVSPCDNPGFVAGFQGTQFGKPLDRDPIIEPEILQQGRISFRDIEPLETDEPFELPEIEPLDPPDIEDWQVLGGAVAPIEEPQFVPEPEPEYNTVRGMMRLPE